LAPDPQNHLIELLPRSDRSRLLALCQPVQLQLAEVMTERGQNTRHVWFPLESCISLVAQIDHHPGLAVGMVGSEGMLGAPLALGVSVLPLRSVVQGGGSSLRVAAGPFKTELARSVPLQRLLGRYLYVRMEQLAASAACLRFHLIGPRLARWLLMSQDRAQDNRLQITHEFLACMLGVRRVGITVAAGSLQRSGLIRYHRGELFVLDRQGLMALACPCYAADLHSYETHLG
jgi:CRP-like cAMP-binding protein